MGRGDEDLRPLPFLGRVHRGVGHKEQLLTSAAILGGNGDTARNDQRDDLAVGGYIGPCARGVGDARGDRFGLRPSTSRQRQHKLVAAIASGKITAPTTLAQHVRHTPQHVIAGQVAVDIVEELEVVDVEHQYRAWLAIDYPAAMRAAVRARSSQR